MHPNTLKWLKEHKKQWVTREYKDPSPEQQKEWEERRQRQEGAKYQHPKYGSPLQEPYQSGPKPEPKQEPQQPKEKHLSDEEADRLIEEAKKAPGRRRQPEELYLALRRAKGRQFEQRVLDGVRSLRKKKKT